MNMITYQINQISTQFYVLRILKWKRCQYIILSQTEYTETQEKKKKSYLQCYSTIVTSKKNKNKNNSLTWMEEQHTREGLKIIYTDFIMIFGTKFKIQMHPKIHFGTSF